MLASAKKQDLAPDPLHFPPASEDNGYDLREDDLDFSTPQTKAKQLRAKALRKTRSGPNDAELGSAAATFLSGKKHKNTTDEDNNYKGTGSRHKGSKHADEKKEREQREWDTKRDERRRREKKQDEDDSRARVKRREK